jgi:hypothetical protein
VDDGIARHADDPFYQVSVGREPTYANSRPEHDDIPASRFPQTIRPPIDHDQIAMADRWPHGRSADTTQPNARLDRE